MSQKGANSSVPGIPGLKKHQQAPIKDGPLFSLGAKKGRSGKFMSHLLGLDQETTTNPNGTAAAGKLSGVKLGDLFAGIKFTPNFMFFLLFLGFFLWLFVIYWVRHHEPLADQVLGTPKADPRRSVTDRRLVQGIKQAFPMQTSPTSGEVYVPGTPPLAPPEAGVAQPAAAGLPQGVQMQAAVQAPMSMQAMPIQQQAPLQPTALAPAYGSPYTGNIGAGAGTAPLPLNVSAGQANYVVQGQHARVKTIVSR